MNSMIALPILIVSPLLLLTAYYLEQIGKSNKYVTFFAFISYLITFVTICYLL